MSDYNEILSLYTNAFPKDERIPLWLLKIGSKSKKVDFLAFYDEQNANKFVGFVYLLHYKKLSYLCFFAIDEAERGKGYGSEILKWMQMHYAEQTILLAMEEIDRKYSNYEERIKRRNFYLKNDFAETEILMIERKVRYSLMIFGQEQSIQAYKQLFKRYASGLIRIKLYDKNGKRL